MLVAEAAAPLRACRDARRTIKNACGHGSTEVAGFVETLFRFG